MARSLSTHQSQGLILLREIKVKPILFAALPLKYIFRHKRKACMACWAGAWRNWVYEHHLLAASLLTGCKLHPVASKIAAPLHDARENPSFRECSPDRHRGRGQQGSLNYPNFPKVTQVLEGELGGSLLVVTVPMPPGLACHSCCSSRCSITRISNTNKIFWPQQPQKINSAKGLGAFEVFVHLSCLIILRTKSNKSTAIYNLTFQLRF